MRSRTECAAGLVTAPMRAGWMQQDRLAICQGSIDILKYGIVGKCAHQALIHCVFSPRARRAPGKMSAIASSGSQSEIDLNSLRQTRGASNHQRNT